jgi:hypothetical protein
MLRRVIAPAFALACASPFVFAVAKQDPKDMKAEEVYVNIKSFKGHPAVDLIPAMEFMAASMQWECKDCHDPADYSKETHNIETTRKMIDLQREINTKWFDGRQEVTCMTCHRGEEHPTNLPLPGGAKTRYARAVGAPRPPELFAKHIAAVGKAPVMLKRTGTLTAPNDVSHEVETKPLELYQTSTGKFRIVSGDRLIVCDGAQVTYYGSLMWGEPVAIFQRVARLWFEGSAFDGLAGGAIAGKDQLSSGEALVVRAQRASTDSSEDLSFDAKSGLLVRMLNVKKSPVGSVVTAIDYEDYKDVDGAKLPMKVTVTFAGGQTWMMAFTTATASATVDESLFKIE